MYTFPSLFSSVQDFFQSLQLAKVERKNKRWKSRKLRHVAVSAWKINTVLNEQVTGIKKMVSRYRHNIQLVRRILSLSLRLVLTHLPLWNS